MFSYKIFKTGSFVKSDGAQSDGSESRLGIKTYENTNFSSESLAFLERFTRIMSKSLTTHFLRAWQKRLDHSRTLFFRAPIAICSQSHFCKEGQEQIAHGCFLKWAILRERAKSKWAKERIPNSRFLAKLVISMEEYCSYEKVTICVFFVRKRNDLRLFCLKK